MIPTVDPNVKYVGSSWLRGLNIETMKSLAGAVVVQNNDSEPLVVILPYETYITLQRTVRLNMKVAAFERLDNPANLDAVGPELASGRGKASTETFKRVPRPKGDKTQ